MNKKVLIACYFFPPMPGIGGRRSAKFAKYLAKNGNEIFTIQARNPFPTVSSWLSDVENNPLIHKTELPLQYPVEFIIPPTKVIGKVKYKLASLYFDFFHSKKNKYDYTINWEREFLKTAEALIAKNKIDNIIVSGPPFYYALYAVKLKRKYPHLNVIVDFRDPWIGSPYYGMSTLKKKQHNYEVEVFNFVYLHADYFIGPNQFLLDEQKKFIVSTMQNAAKFIEIQHAYDADEFKEFGSTVRSQTIEAGKIKLVYGGQFYPGTEALLKSLSAWLTQLKSSLPNLYHQLQFEFFTPEMHFENLFTEHLAIVSFQKPIGNLVMKKIADADICLIFLAEHNKDFKTTKFLEYSALNRPFLVLGPKGHVAEYVTEMKLGASFDENDIDKLSSWLEKFNHFLVNDFNLTYDSKENSFEKLITKLEALLK